MPEVKIITEEKKEEKPQDEDIKKTLKAADEYQKLKEENDRLEAEYLRQQELKAKITMAGRAQAGQTVPEKTQEEKDKEEAAKILSIYR